MILVYRLHGCGLHIGLVNLKIARFDHLVLIVLQQAECLIDACMGVDSMFPGEVRCGFGIMRLDRVDDCVMFQGCAADLPEVEEPQAQASQPCKLAGEVMRNGCHALIA